MCLLEQRSQRSIIYCSNIITYDTVFTPTFHVSVMRNFSLTKTWNVRNLVFSILSAIPAFHFNTISYYHKHLIVRKFQSPITRVGNNLLKFRLADLRIPTYHHYIRSTPFLLFINYPILHFTTCRRII